MLWDRLAGGLVPAPEGTVLLGRYQIPPGEHGFALGGATLAPRAYLAVGDEHWTLRRGGERWRGDFGGAPTPEPIVMESIAFVAAKAAEARDAPLSTWTAIPPLVSGVTDRLARYPLENQLRVRFGHLKAACHEPHARLRTEHVLTPVSKARRITWRTVVHLAAHSETWAARRMHGVEPARLLTPVQVADHDLYENRVVATLLDRLWRHVQVRLAEIDKIDLMVRQGRDMVQQAEARLDWREKHRLYAFIAELLMTEDLNGRIEQRRKELTALRDGLALLLTSRLRAGVRGPYTGPPRLRPTNLFDNDVRYRNCRQLWNAEVAARRGAEKPADPVQALAGWCRDFADYSLVLVLRALEQVALAPPDAPGPAAGEPGPAYTYRGRQVRLDRELDDTFSLLLDGEPVLRIVPVPHALTATGDLPALDRHLDALRTPSAGPAAVLYPGEGPERAALPLDRRLAVHSSWGTDGLPRMVPVSPTDLGSTARIARTLRSALDARIMLDYPVSVPCRLSGAEALAARFDWLVWNAGQLTVIRPPAPYELGRLDSALAGLRVRADAARRQGDNTEELNRLRADLHEAADRVTRLTHCPVCPRPAAPAVFVPRDHGTYRCQCQGCSTAWETRRCPRCERNHPVLTVQGLADQRGGEGDRLDETFSQELLAVPCWRRPRSYICTFCGHCPEPARESCARCSADSSRCGGSRAPGLGMGGSH